MIPGRDGGSSATLHLQSTWLGQRRRGGCWLRGVTQHQVVRRDSRIQKTEGATARRLLAGVAEAQLLQARTENFSDSILG